MVPLFFVDVVLLLVLFVVSCNCFVSYDSLDSFSCFLGINLTLKHPFDAVLAASDCHPSFFLSLLLLFVSFGCFLVVTAFAATPSLSHPVSP
jgi:hypothetical protein